MAHPPKATAKAEVGRVQGGADHDKVEAGRGLAAQHQCDKGHGEAGRGQEETGGGEADSGEGEEDSQRRQRQDPDAEQLHRGDQKE